VRITQTKCAFAALVLLVSGVSSAATIDFESVSDGDLTPTDPFSGERYFSTDGFDFSTTFGGIGSSGGNQFLFAMSAGQLFSPGPQITFSRSDSQAFGLFGMDVNCMACTIRGVKSGGGFLDTTDVNDLGSGDWLNLTSVFVFEPGGGEGLVLGLRRRRRGPRRGAPLGPVREYDSTTSRSTSRTCPATATSSPRSGWSSTRLP